MMSSAGNLLSLLHDFHGAMVIAMVTVWMMQMPVDKVINMITVRHGFMSASRTMHVTWLVTRCPMGASIRVLRTDFDLVLVDVVAVRMVQVPIVQVIHVVTVLDRSVAASWAVLVIMMLVMRFVAGRAHFAS
jgi:hypothetical protein